MELKSWFSGSSKWELSGQYILLVSIFGAVPQTTDPMDDLKHSSVSHWILQFLWFLTWDLCPEEHFMIWEIVHQLCKQLPRVKQRVSIDKKERLIFEYIKRNLKHLKSKFRCSTIKNSIISEDLHYLQSCFNIQVMYCSFIWEVIWAD